MIDFSKITIDVESITSMPGRKIVKLEANYPTISNMNIMQRAIKTRARARALIATGIVNTTLTNIKALDIQRFTTLESFEITDETSTSQDAELTVIVEK